MTPEGKVKAKLKKHPWLANAYQYWPVPSGYGKQTLDCICCEPGDTAGQFVGYECKRFGIRKPTPRQAAIMREMRAAGGRTFIVTPGSDGELEFIEITR